MDVPSSENVRSDFYFADLIFVVFQSSAKTAKIGSLENFRLHGTFSLKLTFEVWCNLKLSRGEVGGRTSKLVIHSTPVW